MFEKLVGEMSATFPAIVQTISVGNSAACNMSPSQTDTNATQMRYSK